MAFSFTRFVFTCNHYWAKRFKKSRLSTSVLETVCGLRTCNFYVQSELSSVFLNSFRYELFDTRLGAISSGFIVAGKQALQFGREKWVTRECASERLSRERRGLLFSLRTAALNKNHKWDLLFPLQFRQYVCLSGVNLTAHSDKPGRRTPAIVRQCQFTVLSAFMWILWSSC